MRNLVLLVFITVLVLTAIFDGRRKQIPNYLVIIAGIIGILSIPFYPEITIGQRIFGMVSVSVPLLLITLLVPGAFGGGDIKLMAACGIFLGWRQSLLALEFAILAAGVYSMWLLVVKRAGRRCEFAFGPFLCAGMAVVLLSESIPFFGFM